MTCDSYHRSDPRPGFQLIADLRRRIRLLPSAEQSGAGTSGAAAAGPAGPHSASHEMALLQNIRFAFQVERRMHTSWLKVRAVLVGGLALSLVVSLCLIFIGVKCFMPSARLY